MEIAGVVKLLGGAALLALWVMTLVDCLQNRRLSDTQRMVWIVVLVLANCLGILAYWIAKHLRKAG